MGAEGALMLSRPTGRLTFAVMLGLALTFVSGAPARAQGDRDLARGKAKQAAAAYDLGHYDKAARLYEEAYTAVQDDSLLFNIGQSYRMAGQTQKALTAYRSYLRKAPKDAPVRAQVEARVAELEKIAADTRESQAAPPSDQLPAPAGSDDASIADRSPSGVSSEDAASGPSDGLWLFGVGLGLGSLRAECDVCDDTFEAGGLNGHVGRMLRPDLALLLDVWAMVHSESALTVWQNIGVLAVRYWFTPRFWATAGLGVASAGYRWRGVFATLRDRTENKPGFMVAGGYEFYRTRRMGIDGQLRFGTGFYADEAEHGYTLRAHSIALGLALNFY
jgi:tetratricopeptide (TPR) repeat protein